MPRRPTEHDDLREDTPLFNARARTTDPDTSHDAADLMNRTGATSRHARFIVTALTRYGPLTGKEIADQTTLTQIQIMRRMSELRDAGLVEDTGDRRERQIVWRLR